MDPSANRSFDFIDGLRGIAILMVIICHHFYVNPKSGPAIQFLGSLAGTFGNGVLLFFTLSGFLISWPFWRRKANRVDQIIPPGYGWRRFWKIYPPLALSVLFMTPLFITMMGQTPLFIRTAAEWLTGLAFIVPVSGQLNPVMWSLVVEVHFYLILPLLFLLTKPLSSRTCLWFISLFMLAVPLSIQFSTGLCPTYHPEISDPLFTGLSCFCFGVTLAGLDNLKIWNRGWAKIADAGWVLMLIGLLGLAWLRWNTKIHSEALAQGTNWLFMMGSGCLLCYATATQKKAARWLCNPWLRWCGIISYEWYLFHEPLAFWSRVLLGPANGNIFRFLLITGIPLMISLAIAAFVYRMFSLPILKYGRSQKLARKQQAYTVGEK